MYILCLEEKLCGEGERGGDGYVNLKSLRNKHK